MWISSTAGKHSYASIHGVASRLEVAYSCGMALGVAVAASRHSAYRRSRKAVPLHALPLRLSNHMLELEEDVADTATSSSGGDSDSGSYGSVQAGSGEEGSLDSRRDFPSSSDAFSFGFLANSEQQAEPLQVLASSVISSVWPFCSAGALPTATTAAAEVLAA